jgi:hypothetical protein
MNNNKSMNVKNEVIAFDEAQLILSEKRTALSFMRTGIAVFALPLSVLSILVATSRYYSFMNVLHFIIPLLLLCLSLIFLGFYLIIRAMNKIHRYDRIIDELKQKSPVLSKLID